jgi:predicted nucleic acid-binding protein
MGAVLLDSTVIVDHLRGREGARRRLSRLRRQGDEAYVCAVTIEEVTRGIRAREDEGFLRLLGGLLIAPLGIPEGRLAGYWRRTFAGRGKTLSQSDCLIAAATAGIGGRLATGNPRHFPMRDLDVEHWPVGE